jgi:hypothetical protein
VRLALGVSVHTGRAACVAAGGTLERPHVEARVDVELLAEAERFVFHRAAEAGPSDAEALVARARADAMASARRELGRWLEGLRAAGHEVSRCAVLAKKSVVPASIPAIVTAHPRIHTAEGCFYRDVLSAAARECGLRAEVIAPGELERIATEVLGVSSSRQVELLARAGRAVGSPWARDQKAGALAAWVLLAS